MNAAALALAVALAAQTTPAAELKAKFERQVQEITARLDGVAGYVFVDLTSGEKIGHLERETFPTASTIKLAIVYELFKQAAEGRIRLDETMTLDRPAPAGAGSEYQARQLAVKGKEAVDSRK